MKDEDAINLVAKEIRDLALEYNIQIAIPTKNSNIPIITGVEEFGDRALTVKTLKNRWIHNN